MTVYLSGGRAGDPAGRHAGRINRRSVCHKRTARPLWPGGRCFHQSFFHQLRIGPDGGRFFGARRAGFESGLNPRQTVAERDDPLGQPAPDRTGSGSHQTEVLPSPLQRAGRRQILGSPTPRASGGRRPDIYRGGRSFGLVCPLSPVDVERHRVCSFRETEPAVNPPPRLGVPVGPARWSKGVGPSPGWFRFSAGRSRAPRRDRRYGRTSSQLLQSDVCTSYARTITLRLRRARRTPEQLAAGRLVDRVRFRHVRPRTGDFERRGRVDQRVSYSVAPIRS